MENKSGKKNYVVRLKKARRKRNRKENQKYMIAAAAAIIVIAVLALAAGAILKKRASSEKERPVTINQDTKGGRGKASPSDSGKKSTEDENGLAAKKKAVVASYKNLGIVQVSGYLNVRKEPGTSADVIGKLMGDSACEILDSPAEGWYHISSGGIEGYINSQYVLTGDAAKEKAYELVELRAIVLADNLNIRSEPNTASDVVGQGLKNERYEVVDQLDGWVQIPSGYLSSEYVKLEYSLNEARKLDLKAMVFNMYTDMGISDVDNYLNVRDQPNEKGKIIAKMPSKAAGDILEKADGWYKIQSGKITGYVKSDYILTGQPAKDEALKVAQLMAIVNTDMLNARSEPSTDSKIWTQISNNERYPVLKQIDGWVEIELEEDSTAYVASDYVDVRYALPEAVKFSPLEVKANAAVSLRTQLVNYALQFLGNPYVWGGTSLTKGADCSGFTQSVFGRFGVSLPHYSGAQANMGKAVKSGDMRPGDLVFYANSRGTINHVGIYIGNGQIVNAASRRSGIKISTWNYRSPVKIRNVLGD